MGLTSWKGAVVRKADVTVAKNYLQEREISDLNRIVTMFLDFAEDQAKRRKQIFLKDWRERLDSFLRFNDRAVLPDAGRISRDEANRRAEAEYEQFSHRRRESAESAELKEFESAAQKVEEQKKRPGRKRES